MLSETAGRRRAMARSHAAGLTAKQAAKATGIPRATLCRWEKRPDPFSRRPHHPRGRRWTAALARAVEESPPVSGAVGFKGVWVLHRDGHISTPDNASFYGEPLEDYGISKKWAAIVAWPSGHGYWCIAQGWYAFRGRPRLFGYFDRSNVGYTAKFYAPIRVGNSSTISGSAAHFATCRGGREARSAGTFE
jgi:hypothetical protein